MIVATIAEKNPQELTEKAKLAKEEGAEVIEARLDFIEKYEGLGETLRKIELPVIATCRPEREGGNFKGPEYERIELLKKAAVLVEFVDIEYDTDAQMRQEIRKAAAENGTVVIISRHYPAMPTDSELERTYSQARKWGDLAKIVPRTKSMAENKRLLKFLSGKKDAIVFASGEKGKATRVVAEKLGSVFTYACLGKPVAEGQMQIKELKAAKKSIPSDFEPGELERIKA